MNATTRLRASAIAMSLLAAGAVSPMAAASPASAALVSDQAAVAGTQPDRTIGLTYSPDRDLMVGDRSEVTVTVDTSDALTVRFQQRLASTQTWTDLDLADVAPGADTVAFEVPTEVPAEFDVRVAVDESAAFPAYTSESIGYRVTGSTPVPPASAGDRSTITLSAPSASVVRLGARVTVTGRVTGGTGRTVRIELGTPKGWMPIGSGRTDRAGAYTIPVPTDWYYRGTIRASVTASGSFAAATSAGIYPMSVRPTYTPRGGSSDWASLTGGARWNPCQVITYKVNTTGAPRDALSQVKKAFRLVHRATGLRFAYAGTTTAVPYRTDGHGKKSSDARFTLGWGSERQVAALRGNVVGYGGASYSGDRIQEGSVVLDRGARLTPGFGVGPTWGTLLLHEIGHAVGLDHARGAEQVMHSGINALSRGQYQAGDLTGLGHLGAMGGCFGKPTTWARAAAPRWVGSE